MGRPTRFNQVQADAFLGASTDNSPFGKVWYVDGTNGADGNAGDAPDEAFGTIGQAISAAVATRGDTVIVYPGTYTVTTALAPKAHMTFRAANIVPQAPSVSVRGNIANLMTVNVDGVRVIGFEFRATGTTAADLVALASTAAVSGAVFEDCVFHGADQGSGTAFRNGVCGMQLTNGTNAVTGLVVRRCVFRDLGKTGIDVGVQGMPYAKIEHNTFALDTPAGIGIALADTAAFGTGKGYIIRQNEFIGPSTTTTTTIGIVINGTASTTGVGVIRNNYFSYCANAPITQNLLVWAVTENYRGGISGQNVVDPAS